MQRHKNLPISRPRPHDKPLPAKSAVEKSQDSSSKSGQGQKILPCSPRNSGTISEDTSDCSDETSDHGEIERATEGQGVDLPLPLGAKGAGKRCWQKDDSDNDDGADQFYETETIDGRVYKSKIRIVSPACLKAWKRKVKETLTERDALQEKIEEISLEFCKWQEENAANPSSGQSTLEAVAEFQILLEASITDHQKAEDALRLEIESEKLKTDEAERQVERLSGLLAQYGDSVKNSHDGEVQRLKNEIQRLNSLLIAAQDQCNQADKMQVDFGLAKVEVESLSAALKIHKDAASNAEISMANSRGQLENMNHEYCTTLKKIEILESENHSLLKEKDSLKTNQHNHEAVVAGLREEIKRLSLALTIQKGEASAAKESAASAERRFKNGKSDHIAALNETNQKLLTLEEERKALTQERDTLLQELLKARKHVTSSSDEVTELQQTNRNLLLQHQNSVERIHQLHGEEIQAIKKDASALEDKLHKLNSKHDALIQSNKTEVTTLRADVHNLVRERDTIQEDQQSLRSQISALERTLAACKETKDASERVAIQRISSLQAEQVVLESQLAQISVDRENVDTLRQRISNLQNEIENGKQAISMRDDIIVQLRTELAGVVGNDLVLPVAGSSTISTHEESSDSYHTETPSQIALGKRPETTQASSLVEALAVTTRKLQNAPTPENGRGRFNSAACLSPSQMNALGSPERAFNARHNLSGKLFGVTSVATMALASGNGIAPGHFAKDRVAESGQMYNTAHNKLSQDPPKLRSRESTPGPSHAAGDYVSGLHSRSLAGSSGSRQFSGPTIEARKQAPEASPNGIYPPGPTPGDGLTTEIAQNIVRSLENVAKVVVDLREDVRNQGSRTARSKSKHIASPFKPQALRKPRTQDHTNLMRDVRKTMNQMLGINKDDEIIQAIHRGHFISEDEANALAEADLDDNAIKCNLTFMRPCWDAVKTSYNSTLGILFTSHFIAKYPAYSDLEADVAGHFAQRLGSLKTLITRQIPRGNESQAAANERNRLAREKGLRDKRIRQRQWEGFYRRTDDIDALARADASYTPVLEAITTLGVDGYSSDETSDEGYLVKKMPWRNHKLDNLIQIADGAHQTVNANGNRLTGGQMRERIHPPYPPISTTPAPTGLPINFYDELWYENLTVVNQRLLNAGPRKPFPGDDSDMDQD